MHRNLPRFLALASLAFLAAAAPAGRSYRVDVLVSDGAVEAKALDPLLVNGWGIAAGPTTPWWVSDNETATSTLYDGTGAKVPLVVSVPGAPTGVVFNGGTGFPVSDGTVSAAARFLFASEDGRIFGWSPAVPPPAPSTSAFVVVDRSDRAASYKGLAIASTADGDRIYAADFHNARVDVFDGAFDEVPIPGAFVDPGIPSGFAPFGIQNVSGRIVVTYAKQDEDAEDEIAGQGLGFVSVFDADGTFLARIATRGLLNAPWGVALAPPDFGEFGGDLLVGNFGDGRILAFSTTSDLRRFTPRGVLRGEDHKPIEIDGLWGIGFGNGTASGPTNALYFAAGPDDEEHGSFGRIDALP